MEPNPKGISDRIKTYLKNKHGSVADGVRAIGKDPTSARNSFLMGETLPNSEIIFLLQRDGCDIDWLLTGNKKPDIISERKIHYSTEYRIEATIAAGQSEIYDRVDNNEFKSLEYSPRENYFWIQIDKEMGYSMRPFLAEGEYVLLSIKEKVRVGDLVAAKWGKNAAIKIYNETGTGDIILSSYNQLTPFVFLHKKEVTLFKVKLIEKK